jgi:hypothetical protein
MKDATKSSKPRKRKTADGREIVHTGKSPTGRTYNLVHPKEAPPKQCATLEMNKSDFDVIGVAPAIPHSSMVNMNAPPPPCVKLNSCIVDPQPSAFRKPTALDRLEQELASLPEDKHAALALMYGGNPEPPTLREELREAYEQAGRAVRAGYYVADVAYTYTSTVAVIKARHAH